VVARAAKPFRDATRAMDDIAALHDALRSDGLRKRRVRLERPRLTVRVGSDARGRVNVRAPMRKMTDGARA